MCFRKTTLDVVLKYTNIECSTWIHINWSYNGCFLLVYEEFEYVYTFEINGNGWSCINEFHIIMFPLGKLFFPSPDIIIAVSKSPSVGEKRIEQAILYFHIRRQHLRCNPALICMSSDAIVLLSYLWWGNSFLPVKKLTP